ncbi:Ger(x)C family spore germination protein [Paenibacillus sp. sgz500958]|uniref:Ger(x)C family spore germination protein n=1 Tax=Paenibacillus sp. sgz500958 TaxID=3242475 RepID=UPI0036D430DD
MKRRVVWLVLLAQCILLTGCWSSKPIEDLNMEVGIALDAAVGDEDDASGQEGEQVKKRQKLSCAYQFVLPQGGSGSQKVNSQSRKFYNMIQSGDSTFEIHRLLSQRSNLTPIGVHLKVILIGEELARSTQISELIDFFQRDNNIRPSVLLMVSEGRASDVMKKALPGQIPALMMKDIFHNRHRSSKIWEPVSIAKAIGPLHGKTSFLLQNVVADNKEPRFSGAGVIKGETGKLAGFLNENELEGAVWLTGQKNGGVIQAYDAKNDRLVAYEISSVNSKIKASVKEEEISFVVKTEFTGRYAEVYGSGGEELDSAIVEKDEQRLKKVAEDRIRSTVDKMQQELHVEAAGFGQALHIQHPSVWRKVKDNWDEVFAKLPVTFEVKVEIEDNGASGRASE